MLEEVLIEGRFDEESIKHEPWVSNNLAKYIIIKIKNE